MHIVRTAYLIEFHRLEFLFITSYLLFSFQEPVNSIGFAWYTECVTKQGEKNQSRCPLAKHLIPLVQI